MPPRNAVKSLYKTCLLILYRNLSEFCLRIDCVGYQNPSKHVAACQKWLLENVSKM